jgi:hypothetical protein
MKKLLLLSIFFCGCAASRPADQHKPAAAKPQQDHKRLVLDYMKRNTGDPSAVEIVEWVDAGGNDLSKWYQVKARCRNQYGALAVEEVFAIVTNDGQVTLEMP